MPWKAGRPTPPDPQCFAFVARKCANAAMLPCCKVCSCCRPWACRLYEVVNGREIAVVVRRRAGPRRQSRFPRSAALPRHLVSPFALLLWRYESAAPAAGTPPHNIRPGARRTCCPVAGAACGWCACRATRREFFQYVQRPQRCPLSPRRRYVTATRGVTVQPA